MKIIIYLLITLPLLFTSCSNDDMSTHEETVQVTFCAEIPQPMGTRAASPLSVDRVYCAVFENGVEISTLRQVIDIVQGQSIAFVPRLMKGRTYDIVFWACKNGVYNTSNLTSITRSTSVPAGTTEADYDAFTATERITVENSVIKEIKLTRPFAQLNLGITKEDWDTVKDTFGQIPTTLTISYYAKDVFNALQGDIANTATYNNITRTSIANGAEITVQGKTYKSLGMCYVLPHENLNITYTVSDHESNAIRTGVQILNVPFQKNYKTNIIGSLLTSTITYAITFDDGFASEENNKEL